MPHTISAWNALPGYVTNMTTPSTFKNAFISSLYTPQIKLPCFCFVCIWGTTYWLYYAIPVPLTIA